MRMLKLVKMSKSKLIGLATTVVACKSTSLVWLFCSIMW